MNCRLIVAMTAERLIGRKNDLPWHWPEDLAHFKRSTKGGTVIMGRKSFESLGGKPLPKRTNLVVSARQGAGAGPDGREQGGVRVFADLPTACDWVARTRPGDAAARPASGPTTARAPGPDAEPCPWILGGAEIFRLALAPLDEGGGAHAAAGLPRPVELVVTWVPSVPLLPDDVRFPYDRAWIERHYEAVEHWWGESGELEFVLYRLREAGAG